MSINSPTHLAQPRLVRLKPFPELHESLTKSYRVWAGAVLSTHELRLYYKIQAASERMLSQIIFGSNESSQVQDRNEPQRKNELWTSTCFEAFIPSCHSQGYLEFNGSPQGDWNWYSFRSYRQGQVEFQLAQDAQPQQKVFHKTGSQIEMEWGLPWIGVRQGFQSLGENQHEYCGLGLTVVLHTTLGTLYWALSHEGLKPDFHLRKSFIYDPKTS